MQRWWPAGIAVALAAAVVAILAWPSREEPVREVVVPVEPVAEPVVHPGKLPFREAKPVLAAREPELRACYEEALYRRAGLSGRWSVALEIRPDGTVKSVEIQGAPPTPDLEACMDARLREWTFPQSERGTTIRQSFRFDP